MIRLYYKIRRKIALERYVRAERSWQYAMYLPFDTTKLSAYEAYRRAYINFMEWDAKLKGLE